MENARENIELNKEKLDAGKFSFHDGKAEFLLPEIVKDLVSSGENMIGLVDPPR